MNNFTRISRAAAWIIFGGMLILAVGAAHQFTAVGGELNQPANAIQLTGTPQPQDISEIGSTDDIVVLGFLIGLIVITPILLQRKMWSKN
jgi:hypothetical protein